MSDWTWEQIEQLTRAFALILLQAGTPQEAAPLPEASERAIDLWVAHFANEDPPYPLPVDPLQKRGLLARMRYASTFASQCRIAGNPPIPNATEAIALETMLIDYWYETAKPRWLAGERGIKVAEN